MSSSNAPDTRICIKIGEPMEISTATRTYTTRRTGLKLAIVEMRNWYVPSQFDRDKVDMSPGTFSTHRNRPLDLEDRT
jgi:hypothetical protein